jgi:hypothetical protein
MNPPVVAGPFSPPITRLVDFNHATNSLQLKTNPIFPGIKHKVENKHQYEEYLEDLKGVREELGINLKEDLYPEGQDSPYFNP